MILGFPIWMLLCVIVVITNWLGIHPDWEKAQIKSPNRPIQWLLWLYVVALCLGYVSISLILVWLIFG